ncbi:MAG: RAMP superfamily CRISPR-associated protein [Thermodesulfobacteriota bacterium]
MTPGFVGGADPCGRWRTPPFKAALREWWRIVWWNDQIRQGLFPAIANMRDAEGTLFGSAADAGSSSTKSRIAIRLETWRKGTCDRDHFRKYHFNIIVHPEVEVPQPMKSSLYLGYGPVAPPDKLKNACAIQPGEANLLRIRFPDTCSSQMEDVIQLMTLFGTIGGRSRNGWGSFWMTPNASGRNQQSDSNLIQAADFFNPSDRSARCYLDGFASCWSLALHEDWCHAIGKDNQGLLIWCTEPCNSFAEVIDKLAEVKIAFRTQFHFQGGGPHPNLCNRQIIAYPITRHILNAWGFDSRNANQIRFKVLPVQNNNGQRKFRGLVVHLPHGMPDTLKGRLDATDQRTLSTREISVWKAIHAKLDTLLTRLP